MCFRALQDHNVRQIAESEIAGFDICKIPHAFMEYLNTQQPPRHTLRPVGSARRNECRESYRFVSSTATDFIGPADRNYSGAWMTSA